VIILEPRLGPTVAMTVEDDYAQSVCHGCALKADPVRVCLGSYTPRSARVLVSVDAVVEPLRKVDRASILSSRGPPHRPQALGGPREPDDRSAPRGIAAMPR
jgi:hypothetical protein